MANIKSIQLLRNTSQLYATRADALAALTGSTVPAAATDGTPVLARYKNESGAIITLVGYYAVSSAITGADAATTHMTVFDYEGNIADIEELKNRLGTGITTANTATAQLIALSGNAQSTSAETSVAGAKKYADDLIDSLDVSDTAVDGSYVSQVSETNGKISVSRVALPSASTVSGDSKVVIDVTQDKGKITATAADITSVKLAGYTEGSDADIAATDTLGQALGKLQAQINAMDKDASAVNGQVVTTVAEEDGKVTETKANVKDLQLGGYAKDTAATGNIASDDTINAALSKLENKAAAITIANADGSINVTTGASGTDINVNIKSDEHVLAKDGSNGIYTNISLSSITPTSTTVKEEYQLTATDGTKLGETIKIYKDSSIVEIYLGTSGDSVDATTGVITKLDGDKQYLNYVYFNADGKYEMTQINISVFITEQEFASGVTFDSTENKVKGVVDPDSEKNSGGTAFLTVDAAGFKVNGIKQEIIDRINELDAVVTGGTTAGTATSNHVQVIVGEVDGKLTGVTVTEANVADKDKLEALSAKTVTEVGSSNASISATSSATTDGTVKYDIVTDASKVKMTGFTAETSGLTAITTASTVTEAVKAIESEMIHNEEITSTALNDLEDRKAEKTDVNTMYNHLEDEIRELQSGTSADLADEIAARKAVDGQNGQTYVANAGKKYISGATSLNDADILLNNAIENITGNWIEGVQINGVNLPEASNKVNATFSASTTYSDSANAIVITQDSTTGGLTFALGTLDAGTY